MRAAFYTQRDYGENVSRHIRKTSRVADTRPDSIEGVKASNTFSVRTHIYLRGRSLKGTMTAARCRGICQALLLPIAVVDAADGIVTTCTSQSKKLLQKNLLCYCNKA